MTGLQLSFQVQAQRQKEHVLKSPAPKARGQLFPDLDTWSGKHDILGNLKPTQPEDSLYSPPGPTELGIHGVPCPCCHQRYHGPAWDA